MNLWGSAMPLGVSAGEEGQRAEGEDAEKKEERLAPRWFLGALRRCK